MALTYDPETAQNLQAESASKQAAVSADLPTTHISRTDDLRESINAHLTSEGYGASASVGPKITDIDREQDPMAGVSHDIQKRVDRQVKGDGIEEVHALDDRNFASTMSVEGANQIGGKLSDDMANAMRQIRESQRQSGTDLLKAIQFQSGDIDHHNLGTLNAASIVNNMGGQQQQQETVPGH